MEHKFKALYKSNYKGKKEEKGVFFTIDELLQINIESMTDWLVF